LENKAYRLQDPPENLRGSWLRIPFHNTMC